MSFSMFKENFTSGFTSIRRRLSSSDIPTDVADDQQRMQPQQQQQQQQQPAVTSSGSQQQLSQPQINKNQQMMQQQQQQARPNALPTQQAPPQLQPGKMSSAPASPQQTAVPTFARGLISAASNYVSAAVSSATSNKDGTQKGKTLLVIDDESSDWPKYFRGRKINDTDLRVEQADFRELHLVSMPRGEVVVEIHAQRGGAAVQRYLKPDMVLVRQHVLNDTPGRLATDDNRRLIVGLDTSGMPAVNSLASIYNFSDRGWVYSNLLKIQRRFGPERFPLIEKSFYANYQELIECPPTNKGAVVIKTGNGHVGLGKMKLEAGLDIREIAHLLMGSTTGGQCYLTVEPFIDARADIYIIKIGAAYKVYSRKSAQGHWKATIGPQHLELVQLNDRYKFWVDQCSELFGGLDIVAVCVMQAKDGREFIVEVKDSTAQLSQEAIHDDERRLIADLCVSKLNYFSRGDAALRANSQQSSQQGTPIQKQSSMSAMAEPKQTATTPAAQGQHQHQPSGPLPPQQQPQQQQQPLPPQPQQQQPPAPRPTTPLQTQAQQLQQPPAPRPAAPVPPPPQPQQVQQPIPRPVAPPQPSQPPQPLQPTVVPTVQPAPPPIAASSHNPFLADMASTTPMPPKPMPPSQQQPHPPPQGMPPPIIPMPTPAGPPPTRAELPRQTSLQQTGSVPPPLPVPPVRAPPPLPPPATRQPSLGGPPPPLPPPANIPPGRPGPPGASGSPIPPLPQQQSPASRLGQGMAAKSQSLMEDTEDTMKNLKKTFAGIFGEM